MRNRLTPILFDDHDPADAAASRQSIVAPAQRSAAAMRKAVAKVTDNGLPVHSFRTLLMDLATINRNTVEVKENYEPVRFEKTTRPTPLQQQALDLLGVKLLM